MKKIVSILVMMTMIFSMAGCGNSAGAGSKPSGNSTNTVQGVMEQQMQEEDAVETEKQETVEETMVQTSAQTTAETKELETKPASTAAEGTYDVDLTQLNSTMIYSEVYNMMYMPQDYIGKKIRMAGQFAIYQGTDTQGVTIPGNVYFACIIADATACCSQGLEFALADERVYPDDYPELGDEIVVSGVFETYEENGYTFCHLKDAVLESE